MFLIGLFFTCFSTPVFFGYLIQYIKILDNPYLYYLTDAKEKVFTILMLAFIGMVCGISLMVFGAMQKRNQNLMSSIQNAQTQNICPHCKINIAAGTTECPICGKSIKDKP